MATDPALKAALLAKLSVTPQRLSQKVNKRKQELPMSTEEAVYTIAHQEGIDISKFLKPEEVSTVRGLVATLASSGAGPHASAVAARSKPKQQTARSRKEVRVTIAGVDVGTIPGLSPIHAKEAKAMAEHVYPTIYLFENSVRDVIALVLEADYGPDWWSVAVPKKVRDQADKFAEDEKKDTWHGKRGRRPIDYLLLTQLWKIIQDKWKDFESLFPQGQAWVQSMIENDMNVSRRVIAHMNALEDDDITHLESSFRKWVKHLKAVGDQLPKP
jgi:hypothetical protein